MARSPIQSKKQGNKKSSGFGGRGWAWTKFVKFSKLDWGSYIISIAKTATKNIEALIRSMKFLSPEVALYLYKSTISPCLKYCFHIWAGASSCYLDMLNKLQKRISRTADPSLASSLEPLGHLRNVASLSLFYSNILVDVHLN